LRADAETSDTEYFQSLMAGKWESPGRQVSMPVGTTDEITWSIRDDQLHILWPSSTGFVARAARFRLRDPKSESGRVIELQPRLEIQNDRVRLSQRVPDWNVVFEAIFLPRGGHLEAAVRVRGLSQEDVPLRIEFLMNTPGADWRWWDDARRSRPIDGPAEYSNLTRVLAGYDGQMSRYPYACITSRKEALAIGVPPLRPRVFQLVYDGKSSEYRLAVDVAVSPSTTKFPNEATFSFVLFPADPAHGFRSAIERYGRIYPEAFVKRVKREGVWMPFTRINDVRDAQDFHFGFHEYGAVDFDYNARHGIYSFLYVEPWTYWMAMDSGMPRETAVAMEQLKRNAAEGDEWNRSMAKSTLSSAVYDISGRPVYQFVDQPWCSGTLFFNNSDPDIPVVGEDGINAGRLNLDIARKSVVERESSVIRGWDPFAKGYELDREVTRDTGSGSIRMVRAQGDGDMGAVQVLQLDQNEVRPIWISGYSRAEGVTPGIAINYSLYADLTYQNGSNSWGHAVGFDAGTHSWQHRDLVIIPDAPVKTVNLHVLFRGDRLGQVWFDEIELKEFADSTVTTNDLSAFPSRVHNGNIAEDTIQLRSDGMYLDSMEGWANRLNFRAEHFAAADIPLVYETGSGRTAIFNLFSIFEFTRAMADYLHVNDRLLMGNWVLIDFPFLGALLDVPGKEVHWLNSDHAFAPDPDDVMLYRRSLSGHKPYPLLLNVLFEHFTPGMMRKYFDRSLFYAFYPGMFSHDAASNPYFENPELYERDRDLFLEVIPMVRELSAAGWEPITHAMSSHPLVLIERYGRKAESGLYFAVHHDGEGWRRTRYALDVPSLDITNRVRFIDVRDGSFIPVEYQRGLPTFSTRLSGYGTRVIRVVHDQSSAITAYALEKVSGVHAVIDRHTEQEKVTAERAMEMRNALGQVVADLESGDPRSLSRAARYMQDIRDASEAQKHGDLAWAIMRVENAITEIVMRKLGLSLVVEGADALVSPSESACAIEVFNRGNKTIAISSVKMHVSPEQYATVIPADTPKASVKPGDSYKQSLRLSVPGALGDDAECAMRVVVDVEVSDQHSPPQRFQLIQNTRAKFVSGFDLRQSPVRILAVKPDAALNITMANHQDREVTVKLTARADGPDKAGLSWTQSTIRIDAHGVHIQPLIVTTPNPSGRADYKVIVTAASGAVELGRGESTVVRFPASRNLLADTNAEVRVDSTFAGYSIDPLRDGIVDVEGLSWSESAWASADMAVPHWVEVRWPSPQRISRATVYWAEDSGTYFRSNHYRFQYLSRGKWNDVSDTKTETAGPGRTRHEFSPLTVDGIRLWQETGGGSDSRPNLLWIRELEVLDE